MYGEEEGRGETHIAADRRIQHFSALGAPTDGLLFCGCRLPREHRALLGEVSLHPYIGVLSRRDRHGRTTKRACPPPLVNQPKHGQGGEGGAQGGAMRLCARSSYCAHACAAGRKCSPQKGCAHDWQVKGRKSTRPQCAWAQRRPMSSSCASRSGAGVDEFDICPRVGQGGLPRGVAWRCVA